MNSSIIVALFLFTSLLTRSVSAAEIAPSDAYKSQVDKSQEATPWVRRVSFGIVAHDVGFISDKRENGVDPNWEVQFNRPDWTWWRWLGSPYPSVGVTPSFTGETTAFYFGIFNYEFSLSNKFLDGLTNNFTKNLWFAAGLSTAIHTGPLRKNEAKCSYKRRLWIWFSSSAADLVGIRLHLPEKSRDIAFL